MLNKGDKLRSNGTGRVITIVNASDDFIYFTWDDQKTMLPEKEDLIVCEWHNNKYDGENHPNKWQNYFTRA